MKTRYIYLLAAVSFAVGFALMLWHQQAPTPVVAAKEVSIRLSEELDVLEDEIAKNNSSWLACENIDASRFPVYIYKNKQLTCWTNNKLQPPASLVADTSSVQLLKIAQSNFVLYQRPIEKGVQLVALIMLTRDYPIQNDFLTREWNKQLLPTNAITILDPLSNLGVPVRYKDEIIFRISFLLTGLSVNPSISIWSFVFILTGIVLFTVALGIYLRKRLEEPYYVMAICAWLVVIRLVMILSSFPRAVLDVGIFSPKEFASSWFNPSLGDLWLNVLMVFLVSIFAFRFASPKLIVKDESKLQPRTVLWGVFFSFSLFAIAHYPVLTLQTIAHNSAIDFSITSSLDFSLVRLVSFSALLLAWCTAFLLFHVFVKFIILKGGKHAHRILLTGALLFALINYWERQPFVATLLITWSMLLLIYYFKHIYSLDRIEYKTFSYLFLVLFGFVLNVSVSVYFLNRERNTNNQLRFAESYLVDRDSFGEFLLNDLSKKIDQDVFIQTRIASPFLSKFPIQQKIRQVYLSSYFNKYDVQILLFNSTGKGLGTNESLTFADFIAEVDEEANTTEFEGLYRLDEKKQNVSQQYVLVRPVKRNGFLNGYIVVELSLKKSIPENVYPELLVDNRFRESLRPSNLSYATFVRGKVESQAGNFDYETKFNKSLLGNNELFKKGVEMDGYQHFAVENEDEIVTVISTSTMSVKHFLTNASFYLVLGLLLILLVIVGFGVSNFLRGKQLYYSARIQLLINLSFFIPLLIISIVTLRMLSVSSQEQLNVTYLDRAIFLSEQLSVQGSVDSSLQAGMNPLQELSRVSNTELLLFDKRGQLLEASHSSLFENQLLAPLASPYALERMRTGERAFIVPEQVGSLSFFVAYAKLSDAGRYIAIPFFQSASTVEHLQIEALSGILNIFVFVFIVLLLFSFFVARWITFPLDMISSTLQRTSLQEPNEPLRWNSNDEIGLMVQSYNGMLQKLKESKGALERMQREQAWREIAQQVAHEIKNPLTPMKLTLQRLTRSIRSKEVKQEQLSSSLDSMLEQVEVLNAIASSFSSFAKLPTAKIEKIDLRPLLNKVCELYDQQPEEVITGPASMPALADMVIVQTIFSNIIINAIQARHEERTLVLQITCEQQDEYWQIMFKDNGKGIEADKAEKLFLPHFTTKETGSGLGLAIAKRGVEQISGTISFTSVLDQGTTFIVTIPRAES